ncbi:MAG: SGNH/GDSL hydrolase family protein [bacterium]
MGVPLHKKIFGFIRDTWLILGIGLVAFALLEFIIAFFVINHFTPPDPRNPDVRANADAYKTVSWGEEYFKEFNESFDARWEPYVYWRRKPFSGKYITIDSACHRITPTSEIRAEHVPRVFMFGGSTMWGTGARDSFTVPAILGTDLRRKGIDVEVTNFGESGYVTTQEVIVLMRELQKGNIPDLVVFYDGINDTYSAYQQGVPGLAQNESNRAQEFNMLRRLPELRGMVLKDAVKNLATVRLAKYWLGIKEPESKPEFNPRVAEEAVDLYWKNMELVKALAASYKFQYQFYWQPTLFGKKNRSAYEQAEYNDQKHLEKAYQETYRIVRDKTSRLNDKSFRDISDIFQNEEEPVFIDWMHLSEKGNAAIAGAMVEEIALLLRTTEGKGN